VRGGGGVYVGGTFHGGSFHGGRDIDMKGAPDFPALFKKKDQKLNKKKSFSTENKEQHPNLKRTENIAYMIGFAP
jgi:hypothetical protein